MSSDRQAYVQALQTERAFLSRSEKPDAERIKQVDAQLDAFADKPTARKRETR